MDYSVFSETKLMRAIIEEDVEFLASGSRLDVLGRKVFGLEVYGHVTESCAQLSKQRKSLLHRLKWGYLARILTASSPDRGKSRGAVMRRLDHANGDAARLVQLLGCNSQTIRRIVAETNR